MVRHLLLSLILIIGGAAAAFAQNPDGKSRDQLMKEIREFKVKFIAQEIDLQDDQKARFIELYTQMNDKRIECMKDALKMERDVKKNASATEADYQAATEAMTKAKAEDAAIEKSYDEKFAQFLSQKQIYKMKEAENEFRKKMSEMRHKHSKNGKKK